jgi:hypothetical protein
LSESDLAEDEESIVRSMVNLVKRLQKVETEIAKIDVRLGLKPYNPSEIKDKDWAWDEWARKLILELVRFLIILLAAWAGVKLANA